ncbi:MAG: hypothetical protein AB7K04_15745 [Pseudorhodoplanes sp.]
MSDDDTDRLAVAKALSTQAGMLFEDASAGAIMVGDLQVNGLRQRLSQILDMNMRAGVFLEAAVNLLVPQERR